MTECAKGWEVGLLELDISVQKIWLGMCTMINYMKFFVRIILLSVETSRICKNVNCYKEI